MKTSTVIMASFAIVILAFAGIFVYTQGENEGTIGFKLTLNFANGDTKVIDPRDFFSSFTKLSISAGGSEITSVLVELIMEASWLGPEQDTTTSGTVTYLVNDVEVESAQIGDHSVIRGELVTIYAHTFSASTIEGWDSGAGMKTLKLNGNVVLDVDYPDGTTSSMGAEAVATWKYSVDEAQSDSDPDPDPPSNNPPLADANGPYSGEAGSAVSFSSAGSTDSDGSIVSYKWNFGDGDSVTNANPAHVYDATGTYTVTLTVKDNEGASDIDSTQATISSPTPSPNQSPIADPNGPYTSTSGAAIQFSSSGSSDPDGSIVKYEWNFGDFGVSIKPNPTHTYWIPGTYDVRLRVTDNEGAQGSTTTTATITLAPSDPDPDPEPTNELPVPDANGPYQGTVGSSVRFSSSGSSDPDGYIVAYKWTFGDGGSATSTTPYHTYNSAGTFTVTLKVTDNDGATVTTTTPAVITEEPPENLPPIAECNGPYSQQAGFMIYFSNSGSIDPDGSIASQKWNFGDGKTSTSANPAHAYTYSGVYTVILVVTDYDGAQDTDSTTATITADDPDSPGDYLSIVSVSITSKLSKLVPP